MEPYQIVDDRLRSQPMTWVVTGVAGFIGSNLLECLLSLGQRVVGLDNFATGRRANFVEVRQAVTAEQWAGFTFVEGDIKDLRIARSVCAEADYVLHQAALGSVPGSISDPIATNAANVDGFLNMLIAAHEARVSRFVYASSCAVYGNLTGCQVEERTGEPLSPYAVTKCANELYAASFARCYGLEQVGLRYFNVFGPRQDPDGPYAAVIPRWIDAMVRDETISINGDGETSRDFCYVANIVQANLLAATISSPAAVNQVFNVGNGQRTTLNQLAELIRERVVLDHSGLRDFKPRYLDFRPGDIRHSQADISKSRRLLGYSPAYTVQAGLDETLAWHRAKLVSAIA